MRCAQRVKSRSLNESCGRFDLDQTEGDQGFLQEAIQRILLNQASFNLNAQDALLWALLSNLLVPLLRPIVPPAPRRRYHN
jgi:hypothetical protein